MCTCSRIVLPKTLHRLFMVGTVIGLAACAAPDAIPDATNDAVDRAMVTVAGGQLAGAPSSLDAAVWVYRGIRYAAPPVGDLRWRPPQPVTPWDGARDATVAWSPSRETVRKSSARPATRARMTTCDPSGVTAFTDCASSLSVSRSAPPVPSAAFQKTFDGPLRFELKTTRRPSGVQWG